MDLKEHQWITPENPNGNQSGIESGNFGVEQKNTQAESAEQKAALDKINSGAKAEELQNPELVNAIYAKNLQTMVGGGAAAEQMLKENQIITDLRGGLDKSAVGMEDITSQLKKGQLSASELNEAIFGK